MNDYIFLYRGGDGSAGSPEQAQQAMQKWMTWLKALTDKGHVADMGHPLERTGKVVRGGSKGATDGPFTETKDVIGGYTMVRASSLDQAADLTAGCPIFDGGGWVEVRPIMAMNR
jgi:hypothetical protein